MSPRTVAPLAPPSLAPASLNDALPWLAADLPATARVREALAHVHALSVDERIAVGVRVAQRVLAHSVARLDGADLADVRNALGELALEGAFVEADDDGARLNDVAKLARSRRSACRELASAITHVFVERELGVSVALHRLHATCDALEVVLPVRERGDLFDFVALATLAIDGAQLAEIERLFGEAES